MQKKVWKTRYFDLDGLSFDLFTNYATPSTLSVKSSKETLLKFMWKVSLGSRNQSFFHQESEALIKSSVTLIL